MPPKKLRQVLRPEDGLQLSYGNILATLPQFAVPAMQVIENISRAEMRIESMLAVFLKVEVHIAMRMLHSIESEGARNAVLKTAAEHVLSPDDFRLFNATLKYVRASQKRRHLFAHHIWAISPQVPDSIILINPRDVNDEEARLAEYNRDRREDEPMYSPPGPRFWDNAYVFTEKDLQDDAHQAFHSDQVIGRLLLLVSDPDGPRADARRQKLLEEPLIAQMCGSP